MPPVPTIAGRQGPFVVGISGYMDIPEGDRNVIRTRLRTIFRWLREDPFETSQEVRNSSSWWPELEETQNSEAGRLLPGLGLGNHQIVLLTSLAPGADTIAAQVANEEGIAVRAPLPFPVEIYRQSSSFCDPRVDPGAQHVFDELIADGSAPIDAFPVLLQSDSKLDPGSRVKQFQDDLENPERLNQRYRASGEFVATHCHLMIALYDAADDFSDGVETAAGTGAIVHVRRGGSVTCGPLSPALEDLPYTFPGLVLHLRTRSLKRIADPAAIADSGWQSTRARFLPPYVDSKSQSPAGEIPSPAAIYESYLELQKIARSLARGEI